MSQARYCSNCGAVLSGSVNFCPICGAKQQQVVQPQPYGAPPPPAEPPMPQSYSQPQPQPQYPNPFQTIFQPATPVPPGASMFDFREFIINQKLLSIRNTYVIRNRQNQQLGYVKQEYLTLGPHFWFEDNNGNRIGEIEGKVVSIHNEYDIKDGQGQLRGKVLKKLLKLVGTEWWMQDANGNEIAHIYGNIVHHSYEMTTLDNQLIAKVHLAWVAVTDEYCIEIVDPNFDALLVLGYAIALDSVEHQNYGSQPGFRINL